MKQVTISILIWLGSDTNVSSDNSSNPTNSFAYLSVGLNTVLGKETAHTQSSGELRDASKNLENSEMG